MGASFEKTEPYFGGVPSQSFNAASSNAIAGQMLYVRFGKTLIMNVVGAALWAATCFALFFQKMAEQPISTLAGITVLYILVVSIPAGTAIALSRRRESRLRTTMVWMNGAFIALGVMSCVIAAYFDFKPLNLIFFPVVFLVPEMLNISALRKQSRMLSRHRTG